MRRGTDVLSYHALYLQRAFKPDEIEKLARRDLAKVQFDTLIGRGLSGAIVIPRLADALGVAWMLVRKPGESAHSMRIAEGSLGRRWLFVDDFIDTGTTYREVHEAIKNLCERRKWSTQHVGTWVYDDDSRSIFTPAADLAGYLEVD